MKIWKVTCLLLGVILLTVGCGGTDEQKITENLKLGQRYLEEENYEEAIVALSKVIRLDPKNTEAYRMIAAAYHENGQEDDAAAARLNVVMADCTEEDLVSLNSSLSTMEDSEQAAVLAQIAYGQTNDERILSTLLALKGKNHDMDGVRNLLREVDQVRGIKDEYLTPLIQVLYNTEDYTSIGQLSEMIEEKEGLSLVLSLLQEYSVNGEDGIITFLEAYYENGEALPMIDADCEIYVGGYDENGLRSGFGVCFYGENVKPTSRIYVGNWDHNVRSGAGRAYRSADYRIQCQWVDDYPSGDVTILQRTITVLGTLASGHVATSMNLYEWGEWMAIHCTPDDTKNSGYSFQTRTMSKPGTCGHVRSHSYCWDCQQQELEAESEVE
ncbi:MAG: tetratricopeptide repeat protein [Clostridiales bacterium]|nr:tetratricopeptide repeat protein [Clostridiales bacterium]